MSEDNTPVAEDSNEISNAADSVFAPEATTTQANTSSRKKWIIPGAALASTALLSGLIGLSIGNHSGPDFRPVSAMGQVAQGQGGPSQGGPGMNGEPGHGMGNHQNGKGQRGTHGNDGQHHQPGMMPGGAQGGSDIPPTTPHCHDATGADVEVGDDGLCADGSQPGMRNRDGKSASPAPSASSSTAIQ